MLDEAALRGPGFRPDVGVRLADGQSWSLPKPRVTLRRRHGRVVAEARLGDGDYNAVLEAYEKAIDDGQGSALAMFNLAAALLQSNYELSDDQVDSLLEFVADDPANQEAWTTIIAVARGQAPKPPGSGDEAE